ncbi:hypothetical protein DFH11DRAFT_1647871 [Phellopilus nigrolimitatus]|nr:hypothetical protein DFH11DRAFT_1647871 [Phellopilus nigrolimitatus]
MSEETVKNIRGEKYPVFQKLVDYLDNNHVETRATWSETSEGTTGNQYQVNVIRSSVRTTPLEIISSSELGPTVDCAAQKHLDILRSADKDDDNENYLDKLFAHVRKYYFNKGYGAKVKRRVPDDVILGGERYLAIVSLPRNSTLTQEHGPWCLAHGFGRSKHIAAKEALEVLRFKESHGFMWVNEFVWTPKWDYKDPDSDVCAPRFFKGKLPEMNQTLHKMFKEEGLEGEDKSQWLVGYDAAEAYANLFEKQKEERFSAGIMCLMNTRNLWYEDKRQIEGGRKVGKERAKKKYVKFCASQ